MNQPVYDLPETAALDPYQTAMLAVVTEMDRQAGKTGAMVALDPGPIVQAVWDADPRGVIPRVPTWVDGTPRTVGGGKPAGQQLPDAQIVADVGPGIVLLTVEATNPDDYSTVTDQAQVPAIDAEQWALAVLAAARRARELAAELPPPFEVVADDERGGPAAITGD